MDQARATLLRRSVEIVRLGERADVTRLRSWVAASAKFLLGVHDVAVPIGDGPEGAVAFAHRLQASDFEFFSMDTGPAPPASLCDDYRVTLWLLRAGGKKAYQARFEYKDGLLTEAIAHDMVLFHGKIDPK